MTKVKKIIDEAKETKNPELDLADKGLLSFDEIPGLCKYFVNAPYSHSPINFLKFCMYICPFTFLITNKKNIYFQWPCTI